METSNLISRLNFNDSRRVSIGFTYRFGKTTVKNADNRELAKNENRRNGTIQIQEVIDMEDPPQMSRRHTYT